MQRDISGPSHVTAELALNRMLFEQQSEQFILALADYVTERQLVISDQALRRLVSAARAVSSP